MERTEGEFMCESLSMHCFSLVKTINAQGVALRGVSSSLCEPWGSNITQV